LVVDSTVHYFLISDEIDGTRVDCAVDLIPLNMVESVFTRDVDLRRIGDTHLQRFAGE
ncbi:hypothetical protein WG66_006054, partial [Moniliophthora roreri]